MVPFSQRALHKMPVSLNSEFQVGYDWPPMTFV